MTTTYSILDYRTLVSEWYNRFLPEIAADKATFIDGSGIVYLNSLSLEPHKKATMKFMIDSIGKLSNGDVCLVLMEPRPVDNPRLQPLLKYVEKCKSLDESKRTSIFHLANRRYVVWSESVLVSNFKEMELFLDNVFVEMSGIGFDCARFHKSSSLCIADMLNASMSFFPRKKFNGLIERNDSSSKNQMFTISSTNDVLSRLSNKIDNMLQNAGKVQEFIDKCMKSFTHELETMI